MADNNKRPLEKKVPVKKFGIDLNPTSQFNLEEVSAMSIFVNLKCSFDAGCQVCPKSLCFPGNWPFSKK